MLSLSLSSSSPMRMWWLRTSVSSSCRQRRIGVAVRSQQQQQRTFSLYLSTTHTIGMLQKNQSTPIITTITTTKATTITTTTTTLNKNNTRIGLVRLLGTNNNGRNERKFSLVHALLAAPILIFMVLEARVQWLRRKKLHAQHEFWSTIYEHVDEIYMGMFHGWDPLNTFPKVVQLVAISVYGAEEANWPDEVKAMTERPFNEEDFFDYDKLDYNKDNDDDDDHHHQNGEENEQAEKQSSSSSSR